MINRQAITIDTRFIEDLISPVPLSLLFHWNVFGKVTWILICRLHLTTLPFFLLTIVVNKRERAKYKSREQLVLIFQSTGHGQIALILNKLVHVQPHTLVTTFTCRFAARGTLEHTLVLVLYCCEHCNDTLVEQH